MIARLGRVERKKERHSPEWRPSLVCVVELLDCVVARRAGSLTAAGHITRTNYSQGKLSVVTKVNDPAEQIKDYKRKKKSSTWKHWNPQRTVQRTIWLEVMSVCGSPAEMISLSFFVLFKVLPYLFTCMFRSSPYCWPAFTHLCRAHFPLLYTQGDRLSRPASLNAITAPPFGICPWIIKSCEHGFNESAAAGAKHPDMLARILGHSWDHFIGLVNCERDSSVLYLNNSPCLLVGYTYLIKLSVFFYLVWIDSSSTQLQRGNSYIQGKNWFMFLY